MWHGHLFQEGKNVGHNPKKNSEDLLLASLSHTLAVNAYKDMFINNWSTPVHPVVSYGIQPLLTNGIYLGGQCPVQPSQSHLQLALKSFLQLLNNADGTVCQKLSSIEFIIGLNLNV